MNVHGKRQKNAYKTSYTKLQQQDATLNLAR